MCKVIKKEKEVHMMKELIEETEQEIEFIKKRIKEGIEREEKSQIGWFFEDRESFEKDLVKEEKYLEFLKSFDKFPITSNQTSHFDNVSNIDIYYNNNNDRYYFYAFSKPELVTYITVDEMQKVLEDFIKKGKIRPLDSHAVYPDHTTKALKTDPKIKIELLFIENKDFFISTYALSNLAKEISEAYPER